MGKRYLKGRAPPPTTELSKELEIVACVPAETELSKEGCAAPTKTELSEDAGSSASSTIVVSKDFVCVTSQFPVLESMNLKIN